MNKNLCLCLMLSLAVITTGCGSDKVAEIHPPLVKTKTVQSADAASETFSGQVKGRREAVLSFQVGGEIVSRPVDVGSRVRAGDVLMTLNPRDVRQKVTESEAQIASAQAQLELARTNLFRYEELFAAAAIPEAVLDQYRTNYRAAEAAYQNALAVGNEAQNALGYTELTAPADGVITQITAEAGQVVAAGQSVMTLMQTSEIEAEIFLPENRLDLASVGKEVNVRFWANPTEVRGIVREIAPMAGNARTYRIRVTLPTVPDGVEPGMTASVIFSDNEKKGMLLPLGAIYQSGDTPGVWLVKDGTVSLKPVKILAYRENDVLVEGLNTSDHVVISGVHKLQAGQAVREEIQ